MLGEKFVRKNNKGRIQIVSIFVILLFFIGIGFIVVSVMAYKTKDKRETIEEDFTAFNFEEHDIYVDVNLNKRWTDKKAVGAQYDGVIYNNSNTDLDNWSIDIVIPEDCRIDSSWNGEYKLEGQHIQISPVDYNQVIKAGESATFGYVMISPHAFTVRNVSFMAHKIYSITDFALFWVLICTLFITVTAILFYICMELKLRKFKRRQEQDKRIIQQALKTFANFIDAKDSYTKGHSTRVSIYSEEIARRMGLSQEEQDRISYIALMHDVGKIGIPNEILNKPGKLTEEERNVIQMHTTIGAEALKDFTALPGIVDGAHYHHERFSGGGYPTGVKGEEIPLAARIIGVADSYDAMASDRCYRARLTDEQILSELERCSGTQFDPNIVKYMVSMIQDGFVEKVGRL